MTADLYGFLYHSQLASDADLSCVADIVKTARSFNKEHGITGILVFDGLRFCQYIEGPQSDLQDLINRIADDPRHEQFTPKFHAPVAGERLFGNWSMAYVLVDDSEPLDEMGQLDGQASLHKLQQMIPLLDVA